MLPPMSSNPAPIAIGQVEMSILRVTTGVETMDPMDAAHVDVLEALDHTTEPCILLNMYLFYYVHCIGSPYYYR